MPEAKKILVVDDEEFIRMNIIEYLGSQGYEVFEAASTDEALDLIRLNPVRVALVDMRLQGGEGNDLIVKIHEMSPDTVCLVHTGSIDYEIPGYLKDLGLCPEDIIYKPVERLRIFKDKIEEALLRHSCRDPEDESGASGESS